MYPPHHLGGYELIWRGAVRHLRARGYEMRILTTDFRVGSPDPALPEDPDCHRELRWYWRDHRFPRISPRARLRLERHNLATLERHIRGFEPDLVTWWAMGGMSMSLVESVARRELPALAVVMDDWPSYGPAVDRWQRPLRGRPRLGRLVERRSGIPTLRDLAGATRWTFISRAQHERIEGFIGPLPGATVANAGVDMSLFQAAGEHEWRWRLLYCGRIDRRKGIDLAIRALQLLPDEATLTIVGRGDEEHAAELVGLARDLRVSERVRFERVPRDRLAALFADHDVFLFPVRWKEPWGLVPLEAMAVGRPVVATLKGGATEYLRPWENCLSFDAGSAVQLAGAVQRLATDSELRAKLRAGGRQTAAQHTARAFNERVVEELRAAVSRS